MFSSSVVSNFLWPHELQHAMLPWPSPSPGAWSNSHPLSQWCHPTISSSVAPFPCLQSFPGSGSFPRSHLFTSGAKYWSFSFSISPSNEYSGLIFFRVYCFDLLAAQGILKSLHQHHSSKKKSSQSSQIDKVHKRDFLGKCQGGQKIIVIWEGELKGTQTPSLASSVC